MSAMSPPLKPMSLPPPGGAARSLLIMILSPFSSRALSLRGGGRRCVTEGRECGARGRGA